MLFLCWFVGVNGNRSGLFRGHRCWFFGPRSSVFSFSTAMPDDALLFLIRSRGFFYGCALGALLKRLTLFLGFLDVFGAYRCWIWHFFHSNGLPDDAPILIFLMVLLTSVYWLGWRLFPCVTVSLHKGVCFLAQGCARGDVFARCLGSNSSRRFVGVAPILFWIYHCSLLCFCFSLVIIL